MQSSAACNFECVPQNVSYRSAPSQTRKRASPLGYTVMASGEEVLVDVIPTNHNPEAQRLLFAFFQQSWQGGKGGEKSGGESCRGPARVQSVLAPPVLTKVLSHHLDASINFVGNITFACIGACPYLCKQQATCSKF